MRDDLAPLERALGYRFKTRSLVEQAVTHRSVANEDASRPPHNERLEFLGDAVVDLCVGHLLMERLPAAREGQLSKLRASVVSARSLARAARAIRLGEHLRLGRGEALSGGRDKPSILSDALEAVIGAVYLDGGFAEAYALVRRLCGDLVDAAVAGALDDDHKTRLQEVAQAAVRQTPTYAVVAEEGPDHEKTFEVAVLLDGEEIGRAAGTSKKQAEQRAARRALDALRKAARGEAGEAEEGGGEETEAGAAPSGTS